MPSYKTYKPNDQEKIELLRVLQHPGSVLKDHVLSMSAHGHAELTATFYITQEAYDAKNASTDELSETPDPGAEFYRGLAGNTGGQRGGQDNDQ